MPQPLNYDDTYDLVYYLVAPTHPCTQEYLYKLWRIAKSLEHTITAELQLFVSNLSDLYRKES